MILVVYLGHAWEFSSAIKQAYFSPKSDFGRVLDLLK